MRTIIFFSIGLFATACQSESENQTCEAMCDVLVKECQFEAFPSYGACLEGCAFNEAEGADVNSQLKCVEDAVCDTFEIIECENQFGAENNAE